MISKEHLPVTLQPGALNQYLPTPVNLKSRDSYPGSKYDYLPNTWMPFSDSFIFH